MGLEQKAIETAGLTLTLFGRGYCHLCDDMLAGLEPFRANYPFEIVVVDVDESPALEALYGEDVPVLFLDETEICRHFLDESALTKALTEALGKPAQTIR